MYDEKKSAADKPSVRANNREATRVEPSLMLKRIQRCLRQGDGNEGEIRGDRSTTEVQGE